MCFYPAGVLSDKEFALAAEGERDSLRQARLQSGDPDPDLGPLRRFDIRYPRADDQDPVKGYSLDMSARCGDAGYVSAMTFSLDRLYFVKARFSVAKRRTSRRDARREVEAFMAGMVPMLTITSTGDCWMPLPIEALAAGDPAPEGPTSISVAPGPATGFLLGDRVLARDPESVGARLLMLLGMAQTGRLLQGCDGAESANPDVDEGMREIRIEYRAPAESGRGDTLSAAQDRGGAASAARRAAGLGGEVVVAGRPGGLMRGRPVSQVRIQQPRWPPVTAPLLAGLSYRSRRGGSAQGATRPTPRGDIRKTASTFMPRWCLSGRRRLCW